MLSFLFSLNGKKEEFWITVACQSKLVNPVVVSIYVIQANIEYNLRQTYINV